MPDITLVYLPPSKISNMNFVTQLLLLYSVFIVSSALECRINPQDPSKVAFTISVSQSGGGNFTTITDALNSIPSKNDQWIKIFLSPGTYKEKIHITQDKQCIILEGQSRSKTTIVYDNSPLEGQTFEAAVDNFVAKGITFQNSLNPQAEGYNVINAFKSSGDKQAFYSCGFVGFQDTLWDERGRHYFESCYIEGAVDFIWGNGQSVYEKCALNITRSGSITAQTRNSPNDTSGYVFRECAVFGIGHSILGRPYDAFSRVIFIHSNFADVISPEGWYIWHQHGHEGDITFAEVNCTGPGSNASGRVTWLKRLSSAELGQYSTQAFINQDGWINKLPL